VSSLDGTVPEHCDECGFDARRWRLSDVADLFGALGWWWREALAGIPSETLNRRPAEGVWSALEYGSHSSLVTAVNRYGAELILGQDRIGLPEIPEGGEDGPSQFDMESVLVDLAREGRGLERLVKGGDRPWANVGALPSGGLIQAAALVTHAAHDATHHMFDVSRNLKAMGAGPSGRGTVIQVNTSAGGVPKQAAPRAEVDRNGLAGDHQADAKHHGRPFQAVCLWSSEVIAGLAQEGHPIAPGCAGENLTVSGLPWAEMRPGAALQVGSCELEISFPAVPCAKQSRWFTDGDFKRISHDDHPGWARWYAWVRQPGTISVDDRVVLGS